MRTLTRSEMERLPHCRYSHFSKCMFADELSKSDEGKRQRQCLQCAMSGLSEALLKDMPSGGMMCFDAMERILEEIGGLLE